MNAHMGEKWDTGILRQRAQYAFAPGGTVLFKLVDVLAEHDAYVASHS